MQAEGTTIGTDPVIRVRGLVKRYGDVRAVDGIDFDVAPGEVFGLLGPNGAGKTTTVEILEGLRLPDGGQLLRLGQVSRVKGASREASAVPQRLCPYRTAVSDTEFGQGRTAPIL
jgi:ABC-type multidrug transport system ATPase subunit